MTNIADHVRRFVARLPGAAAAALAAAGVLTVGAIDVASGADVRVISLYFVPAAFAGWRLHSAGAGGAAALALVTWAVAKQLDGGAQHWTMTVWSLNVLLQGLALFSVGLLVAVLAEQVERAEALGRTDLLTGLRNRRGLLDDGAVAASLCRRHARPVSGAYIDLDGFKRVNDQHGHARGDEVLQACASAIEHACRRTDIAARLGGDEFFVLMPEAGCADALAVAERLRGALAAHPGVQGTGVTATVGLVHEDPCASDVADLVERADRLMYEGKRGGKDQVILADSAEPRSR